MPISPGAVLWADPVIDEIEIPTWLFEPALAPQELYRRVVALERRIAELEMGGTAPQRSGSSAVSAVNHRSPPIVVTVPAWGDAYIQNAIKYVIPAVKAARDADSEVGVIEIVVHTNESGRFAGLGDEKCKMTFRQVPPGKEFHKSLTAAHCEVLNLAPAGSVVVLLNADIVPSRELFTFARRVFRGENRIIAGCAPRCLIGNEPPPVGATADQILRWAWRNRHPVTEDLVWGRGRSTLPTMLFFERGESVILHCFHLHPFVIHKDGRALNFKGTVDDDVLKNYEEREICYLHNADIGFAELSPASLMGTRFRSGNLIGENEVINYGRNYIPVHIRNFRHALRVIGNDKVAESSRVVSAIASKMQRYADQRFGVARR